MTDEADDLQPAAVHRDAYDQINRLNWSKLRLLEKSPAHFKHGFGDESDSLKLGTAIHMAILEPERFESTYVVFPGKVRRGKQWEEFEREQTRAGKLVVSATEYGKALATRNAVHRNKRAMAYLSGGQPEVTLEWEIAGDGFRFECKGRADYIGDAIVDLKSTQCASPRAFAASAAKYGYFGQAAWYSDGAALALKQRKPFVIIAVESNAPHVVTVFRVPEAAIEHGRQQYSRLLGTLDYCQKRNFWGGYTEAEEIDLEVPEWHGEDL